MSSGVTVPQGLSSGLAGRYAIERELGRLAMEIAGDRLDVTVSQSESDIWVMDLKW